MINKIKKPALLLLAAACLSSASAYAQSDGSVEKFEIFYTDSLAKQGKMLAVIYPKQRLAKDPVLRVNGKDWTFTDSGKNGDVKQGDGIYSATPVMKLTSFVSAQASGSKEPLLELDEIVEGLVNFPMFEGREVVEDDEQREHITSLVNDPNIRETATNLRELLPNLAEMMDRDLFEKLGVDSKVTPAIEVQPRGAKDALVRVMGMPLQMFFTVLPASINPANSLMITDPTVIKDPTRTFDVCTGVGTRNGVWTFAYLMRKLSVGSGVTPEQYALNWLNTWAQNQTLINGAVAVKRPNISKVIASWKAASPGGVLNLDFFPAALMAIVNRPDIGISVGNRLTGRYSGRGLTRGETRLVFVMLDKNGGTYPFSAGATEDALSMKTAPVMATPPLPPRPCTVMPFTVIFEYNNPDTACGTIKTRQTQWRNLGMFSLGSSAYNAALANLTTPIVNNKSLLAHLRTNEIALAAPWELREFRLNSSGRLALDPLEGTPMVSMNNTTMIPNCLVNEPTPFTSNACNAAADPAPTTWNSPNFTMEVSPSNNIFEGRHNFALGTCSGCHTVETGTRFTHIGISKMTNGEFTLSRFLTGKSVVEGLNNSSLFSTFASFSMTTPGPTFGGNLVSFNDIARRQGAMAGILNTQCNPLPFVDIPAANFISVH